MKKDPEIFLRHILENVEKVKEFSKGISKSDLLKDDEKQYAIIRAIEVIGEAVRNLPDEFTRKYSNVSWREIVGTRDKLIHHYFGVDLDVVWKIVKDDLKFLEIEIRKILDEDF